MDSWARSELEALAVHRSLDGVSGLVRPLSPPAATSDDSERRHQSLDMGCEHESRRSPMPRGRSPGRRQWSLNPEYKVERERDRSGSRVDHRGARLDELGEHHGVVTREAHRNYADHPDTTAFYGYGGLSPRRSRTLDPHYDGTDVHHGAGVNAEQGDDHGLKMPPPAELLSPDYADWAALPVTVTEVDVKAPRVSTTAAAAAAPGHLVRGPRNSLGSHAGHPTPAAAAAAAVPSPPPAPVVPLPPPALAVPSRPLALAVPLPPPALAVPLPPPALAVPLPPPALAVPSPPPAPAVDFELLNRFNKGSALDGNNKGSWRETVKEGVPCRVSFRIPFKPGETGWQVIGGRITYNDLKPRMPGKLVLIPNMCEPPLALETHKRVCEYLRNPLKRTGNGEPAEAPNAWMTMVLDDCGQSNTAKKYLVELEVEKGGVKQFMSFKEVVDTYRKWRDEQQGAQQADQGANMV